MSAPDDVVPLVEASQEYAVEVDGPDPVVDFLQTDVVLFERVRDEQQPVFEAEGAGMGDALDEKMPQDTRAAAAAPDRAAASSGNDLPERGRPGPCAAATCSPSSDSRRSARTARCGYTTPVDHPR